MTQKKTNNKKIVIAAAVLVVLIAAFAILYSVFGAKAVVGSKDVTIEVVNSAKESTMYEVQTDAEFLRQAMEEAEGLTFEGDESEFGLMIHTVNGEKADYDTDGAYWSFYVNGEYCNYGIESQPVLDGDAFVIQYEVY